MSELVPVQPAMSLSDVMTMADVIVKSGLFPAFKTRESAATLMLLCRAKGLDPMTAVERYHVVQGRPVMRADAMLGEFVRMGGRVEWHRRDDKEAKATFSHSLGGTVTVSWTIEQARSAKLTGKDVWSQYPRQMLHARCVSEGVRSVLPGATNGLYTPEEAMNMEPVVVPSQPVVVVDAEPVVSAPALEAKPTEQPKRSETRDLALARRTFVDRATELGYDLLGTTGKPSKFKAVAFAKLMFDGEFDADDQGHWWSAYDRLEEVGASQIDETDDEPVGDGRDPFAD